jgi:FkbM family methyltransferase
MLRRWLGMLQRRPETPEERFEGWVEVCRDGLQWRLCADRYVDRAILEGKVFEPDTTAGIKEFVRPGMTVLDVGANFGYFTVLMARLVGPAGKVFAFEPTSTYRKRLLWHVERNGFPQVVSTLGYGLSERDETVTISIGECSATLHPVSLEEGGATETVQLRRLDDVREELGIRRADFVKVDTDGHEPGFLEGAGGFLRECMPVMVIEFSQLNLDVSNKNVMDQCRQLEALGYTLVSEKTKAPFKSRAEFLMECGNYTHTANVWAYPRDWQGFAGASHGSLSGV